VSSRELVELSLRRIERFDPQLNAFGAVYAEQALKAADTQRPGPLQGVPIAVKDEMDIEGKVTSHGTQAFDQPATKDSEIVRRLRAAGAIVIGKTTMPELGLWPFTESITWGVTRNPWDTDRTPGGSSGGSAAAVAAGLVPAAVAADGAGSIRIPAACCGLFGLKPHSGRVPRTPHEDDGGRHWVCFGGLTRSVEDAKLMLDVMAPGIAHPERRRLRIAYSEAFPPGTRGKLSK
jgi:amidase